MNISSFDDLLQAARAQSQPQRLLFVFAGVELPDDATAQQKADFAAGRGGALVPLMCVDKAPHEVESFQALATESLQMGQDWRLVFAAALSGRPGQALGSAESEAPLQQMVEASRRGSHQNFIPFDRAGLPVRLGAAGG